MPELVWLFDVVLVPVRVRSFYESAMTGWIDFVGCRLVTETSASDDCGRCSDGRSFGGCRRCRSAVLDRYMGFRR